MNRQQLREKIDALFPETMACDEHEDFDTCPVIKAKAEAMHLIDEYAAGVIPEKVSKEEYDKHTKNGWYIAHGRNQAIDDIRRRAGIGEK